LSALLGRPRSTETCTWHPRNRQSTYTRGYVARRGGYVAGGCNKGRGVPGRRICRSRQCLSAFRRQATLSKFVTRYARSSLLVCPTVADALRSRTGPATIRPADAAISRPYSSYRQNAPGTLVIETHSPTKCGNFLESLSLHLEAPLHNRACKLGKRRLSSAVDFTRQVGSCCLRLADSY